MNASAAFNTFTYQFANINRNPTSWSPIVLLTPVLAAVIVPMMFFGSKRWDARGKNCVVTGGSQGLGLALSILLAKKGANVTVVARTESKLKDALTEIEKHRQSPSQVFRYLSFPLNLSSGATDAIEAECTVNGGVCPDAFFLCAGSARPYFFVENTEEDLVRGMEQAYWVQAWTAHAATKKLVQQNRPGKIVFVGSTVSLMSFIGYSSYAPGKHALKGLAETLRSELQLYDIGVHMFYAPTMTSPGYEEEERTKPDIQKKIEEGDEKMTPEQAAVALLKGIEKGDQVISANVITRFFTSSTRGSVPVTNVLVDFVLDLVAWIGVPIWRSGCDSAIRKAKVEHRKYLASKGVVSSSDFRK